MSNFSNQFSQSADEMYVGDTVANLAGIGAQEDAANDEALTRAWIFHQLIASSPVVRQVFE